MPDPTSEKILSELKSAEGLYHRLVLLVGPSGAGKSGVLRKLTAQLGTVVINVNLELSKLMLDMTARQRTLQLPALLDQVIDNGQTTVVLDNIEILFDVSLKQDPLRLLQRVARNRCVVVAWNGEIQNQKLTYAEPDHSEYRAYDVADLLLIQMNK